MKAEALFIFCLIAVSFQAELNPYMENTQQILAEIQETHFGQGMLSLLKVHTQVGNSYDAILDLLNDIQTHIEEERDFDAQNWGTTRVILEGIISDAETQYDVNSALVVSQTEALANARAALATAQGDVEAAITEVNRLDGNINTQNDLIADETEAFNCRQDRDAEAIGACNAALDLLRGFCEDDGTSLLQTEVQTGGVFLQVNQLNDVTEQFRALGKNDVKYLPLINALTLLAQSGNYATVDEVIVLITELRDEIQSAYDVDAATYPVNLSGWQSTLGDLTSQRATQDGRRIASEAEVVFQGQQIDNTVASLAIVTGLRDDATMTLDQKRPELSTGIANFEARQALRVQQLQIIDQVKQIFVSDYTATGAFLQTI